MQERGRKQEAGALPPRPVIQNPDGLVQAASPLLTDGTIRTGIIRALLSDSRTALSVIDVQVASRVVVLSGLVERDAVRAAAEAIALEQPGVRRVENQIEVLPVPDLSPDAHHAA